MKTSIVILTCNQLEMTVNCLDSIRRCTPQDYELIVVDNGSSDGTVDYLRRQDDVRLIANPVNLGFAKGCNQGIEVSAGDAILFLNNDTVVPPGWLAPMLRALYSGDWVGMAGPVTNYASGHQQIPVGYVDIGDMEAFAAAYCERHRDEVLEVRRLIGFCLLVKRDVLGEIGRFDERYGLGNYEDDDLCLRAIREGYRLLVAKDSFIHHIGHASIGQLQETGLRQLLEENAGQAAAKWGAPIHEALYRPAIRLSLCLIAGDDADALEVTLHTFAGLADEMIVAACGASDRTLEAARRHTKRAYRMEGEADSRSAGQFLHELAKEPYLLWLQPGDVLDDVGRRKFAGFKLSFDSEYDVVSLPHEQGSRYVTRKAAGLILPEELDREAVRDRPRHRFDSQVKIGTVLAAGESLA